MVQENTDDNIQSIQIVHSRLPLHLSNRCCKLEVYERGHSSSACPHPGANDRFFERPRKLISDQKICRESNYGNMYFICLIKDHQLLNFTDKYIF